MTMSDYCEDVSGETCSYVNVTTDHGMFTVFTWWMTLGRDNKSSPVVIFEIVVLSILAIAALIANLVVLFVILRDEKLRKIPTHAYVAALCADFLLFITITPLLILTRQAYTWTFSIAMCKTILFLFPITGFNAIWIFVLISMDRFSKIVHSVNPRKLAKFYPESPHFAMLGIGVFGMIYFIPLILHFDVYPVQESQCTNSTKCFMGGSVDQIEICAIIWPDPKSAIVWFSFMTIFTYFMPLILMTYNYIQVYQTVKKVQARLRKQKSLRRKEAKTEMEIRVTRMCVLLLVLYIVLWTPLFTVLSIVQFSRVHQQTAIRKLSSDAFYWIIVITLSNAVINPILYGLLNKKFVRSWEESGCSGWDSCKKLTLLKKKSANQRIEPQINEGTSCENGQCQNSEGNTNVSKKSTDENIQALTKVCVVTATTQNEETGC